MDNDDVALADLHPGRQLGRGGQGEVWDLAGRPDQVLKRYLAPTADADVLAQLVAFPARLTPAERDFLYQHTAWPTARVVDGGRVVGVLMGRARADFVGTTSNGEPRLRELQYLLFQPSPLWGDIRPLDTQARLVLIRNFLELMRLLHRHGVVVGDISMMNILWRQQGRPVVLLLDCDTISIEGRLTALASPETPGWNDPLRMAGRPGLDNDRYKLALVVGRVLCSHAYLRPGTDLRLLPGIDPIVAEAVRACFVAAAGPAGSRPDAEAWARALAGRASIPLTPAARPSTAPLLPMAPMFDRGARDVIAMRPLPPRPPGNR